MRAEHVKRAAHGRIHRTDHALIIGEPDAEIVVHRRHAPALTGELAADVDKIACVQVKTVVIVAVGAVALGKVHTHDRRHGRRLRLHGRGVHLCLGRFGLHAKPIGCFIKTPPQIKFLFFDLRIAQELSHKLPSAPVSPTVCPPQSRRSSNETKCFFRLQTWNFLILHFKNADDRMIKMQRRDRRLWHRSCHCAQHRRGASRHDPRRES